MNPKIIKLFKTKRHVVFLTGAGVSTPSGIPDYRSKNGLYRKHPKKRQRIEWYLSHSCLINHPKIFHHFMVKYMYHPNAKPNVIHQVQAKLTRLGRANIITQNVDNLYRLAHTNSKRLIEFHGNIYQCYCQKCHRSVRWQQYIKSPIHQLDGGKIRPNLVLYGENLNQQIFQKSIHIMLNADLIVIVGTSMKVEPFADLIKYHQPNVPIIAINQQPLHFSYNVGLTMIKENALTFFKQLTKYLR